MPIWNTNAQNLHGWIDRKFDCPNSGNAGNDLTDNGSSQGTLHPPAWIRKTTGCGKPVSAKVDRINRINTFHFAMVGIRSAEDVNSRGFSLKRSLKIDDA